MEYAFLYAVIGLITATTDCRFGNQDGKLGDRLFFFWVLAIAWPLALALAIMGAAAYVLGMWKPRSGK